MVGFDSGNESQRLLNQKFVSSISATLGSTADLTKANQLNENSDVSFIGVSMHGPFDFDEQQAKEILLATGNPNGKPNSDVVRPILNAFEITKRAEKRWVIAFEPESQWKDVATYEAAAEFVREKVKPVRDKNNRKTYRDHWWIHGEARPAMLAALKSLVRFPATPRVSKHRIVVWVTPEVLPSDATVVFSRSDDCFFGIIQSQFHSVWALSQGTRLETRPRYTPTTCFETFPFPRPTLAQEAAIAAAAKDLNELRERWLNPPEWTVEKLLEFPGSTGGPWQRYLAAKTVDAKTGVGTVRYPRLEPRDADCAAKLKKRTLTNLYNERPAWLDLSHKKLDAAVAAAYGWLADLTDEAILEKLLALNLERAAEEAKAAKVKRQKAQRGKEADELV
jgi:type II restriction/modification system DNA methylase subunit YeeA